MKPLPDVDLQRVKVGNERTKELLFQLLQERERGVSISHQKMPTWLEHSRFVDSSPYAAWYLIVGNGETVGACYVTKQNEIGVAIFKKHQGKRWGPAAVAQMLNQCLPLPAEAGRRPGYFVANINPQNTKSFNMFKHLGFVDHQVTLAYRQ